MPRHFARNEQILRIHSLYELLADARHPVDDQTLIAALKERLGFKNLSARTLHRDCDFLLACGYPLDHVALPDGRKHGWRLDKEALANRRTPVEPVTLLELVAFALGRDVLRFLEGTVLWTGVESLRHKIERSLTPHLRERLRAAGGVFHVVTDGPSRYAARPRLMSALSAAIVDGREIDVVAKAGSGATSSHRVRPLRLVVDPPRVRLLGLETAPAGDPPVLIDLERIETVTPRDATFAMPPIDVAETMARALTRP